MKATSICSRVLMLTATPLPWLPSLGLIATGALIFKKASQASSAVVTMLPKGTGTPAA